MDYIVIACFVSIETGEKKEIMEYCKDKTHLEYFIFDLLKSNAEKIEYSVYDSNMRKIDVEF